MGNLGKDAKDLLIGNDGSDKEPEENFDDELQKSVKKGIISEDDGKKLNVARTNVDKNAKEMEKNQIDAVKKINVSEVYESAEEERAAIEKKERKKEEEERKRKKREEKVANEMNKTSETQNSIQKTKSQKEREN